MNLTINELTWYKFRCEDCGRVYRSTSRQSSVCPDCKSENVVKV